MKIILKSNKYFLILFIVFFLFFQSGIVMAKDAITIILYSDEAYSVQKKQYTLNQLYEYLENLIVKEGRDTPVYVIFNQDIKFSKILNLRGTIQKVGYSKIRYFYFGEGRRKMAEITMDKTAIPFNETFK